MVSLINFLMKTSSPMLFNLWMPPYNSRQPKCIYWRNLHFLTLVWITSRLNWAFQHLKTSSGMLGFRTHLLFILKRYSNTLTFFLARVISYYLRRIFFLSVLFYFSTFLQLILFCTIEINVIVTLLNR